MGQVPREGNPGRPDPAEKKTPKLKGPQQEIVG